MSQIYAEELFCGDQRNQREKKLSRRYTRMNFSVVISAISGRKNYSADARIGK
jgi:hypothetical protein